MNQNSLSLQQQVNKILLRNKVDPSNPDYAFHSQDIVDLCKELEGDFKTQKSELDTEWAKTDKACKATKASINDEMSSNKQAMENLDQDIAKLAEEIAGHRENLVEA